jgi:hypothetical protein
MARDLIMRRTCGVLFVVSFLAFWASMLLSRWLGGTGTVLGVVGSMVVFVIAGVVAILVARQGS